MWHPAETHALVQKLQPQIIVNNRLQMGSFEEWGHQGKLKPNEDFYTPEQRIGAYDDTTAWETCMTIGTQWAWKPDDQIKTPAEVIHILAECVGGDGNLLFDIGPMPDGRIEPRQVDVLKQVGTWMSQNGESIYGTRGGPWKPTKSIASTRQGKYIYVHILRSKDEAVELPDIPGKIKSATILHGGKIKFQQAGGKLTLTVPLSERDAADTVIKLKLAGSAMDIPAESVVGDLTASASNVFQNENDNYGAEKAFDGDDSTRWATDEATKQAWVAVKYQQPKTVNHVHISEAYANRVEKFEFQYRTDGDWKTLFDGTTLGENFEKSFDPVTASEFRLNILDANNAPTINEIELSDK
jgi:alpha-L-fucosidase